LNDNLGTILLVEDNEDDVFALKRALKKADIHVRLQVAGDGIQATDYLGGVGQYGDRTAYPLPSLVLLDLKLPYKGGIEVLRWVREQPSLTDVPIVILTGSDEARDHKITSELGARAYLVKPPEPSDLLRVVDLIRAGVG